MVRKTKEAAAEADNRQTFTLDEQQSETVRSAIEAGGDVLTKTWERFGGELGFLPQSLILIEVPDDGLVSFTAEVAGGDLTVQEPADDDGDATKGRDVDAELDETADRMIEAASTLALDSGTLVGDIAAGLLNVIMQMQMPYSQMTQQQKRDMAANLKEIAQLTVRQVVDVVAADKRQTVKAVLEKIAIGDKTMITLKMATMPEDETADAIQNLFHCQKKTVLIVTADYQHHMGERGELVPPDEEEFAFDAGRDDEADEGEDETESDDD